MKPESYAYANNGPGRPKFFEPRLVCIETPGFSGTGYVSLPSEQLARSRWLDGNVLLEWVLEGAVQVMRAVLASDGYQQGSPLRGSALSLMEFEDLKFGSALDANGEIQFVVKVQIRSRKTSRGVFSAYQGTALIAAGTLIAKEG
ncbi:hypothetical protein [Methylomagnum sp.]